MIDVSKIRNDFPMLEKTMHGKPLIYLDNGATTLKPQCVIDSVCDYLTNYSGNAHRGDYDLSHEVDTKFEHVRSIVADFIHCKPEEVVYTYGSSDSLNMVAFGYGMTHLKEGDEILITLAEHASNTLPWFEVAKHTGAVVKYIDLDKEGKVTLENVQKAVNENTKIISIAQITNVLGYLAPIKEICAFAHQHDIVVCVDGAQSAPHHAIDVEDLDVDFFAFSGHKMCGPTGVGVLYGKEEWLDKLPPYQGGGEMIKHVSFERTTFNELPFKFEAGTPDYIGTTGLAKALDYVSAIGMDQIAAYEHELTEYATQRLKTIPGMRIFGEAAAKGSVISFLVGDIHHFDMGTLLDRLGIAVRTGHHCAQPLMQRLDIEGTVRASFGIYNTKKEIDVLVAGIERVGKMF